MAMRLEWVENPLDEADSAWFYYNEKGEIVAGPFDTDEDAKEWRSFYAW